MISDRRAQAFAYFRSMGWTPEQSAGIVANLEAESGLRPDAVGDGGLAYGIAQWHPDRQQGFAALIGKPIQGSSFDDQLAWVHAELQGPEKSAGDALRACTTASEAGACVSMKYERPADRQGEADKRAALAERILASQIDAGGAQTAPDIPTPQPGAATPQTPDTGRIQPPRTQTVPALALLTAFAPVLQQLIPQIAALFDPSKKVAERNVGIAQVVLDTIVKTTGQPTLEGSVAAMQADPKVKEAVQQAIVTEPQIMQVMEIGGGIAKAREYDLAVQQNQQPFWKASAVFWVSVILLPLCYWLVGSLIVGGIEIPTDWPWYAQVPFKLFGGIWNGESRSGGFNLVIGLVLGGICGVYYGVSVTQGRNQSSTTERQP